MRELISAVIAAMISALVSFGIFIYGEKFNFETDFQSAAIELQSAKDNINSMINDGEMMIPKYRVLNMQLDWKETLLNYDNDDLNVLYNRLNRLDNLREVMLQEDNLESRKRSMKEYIEIMNEIINQKMLDNGINFIKGHS